jgi:hypothetical protein
MRRTGAGLSTHRGDLAPPPVDSCEYIRSHLINTRSGVLGRNVMRPVRKAEFLNRRRAADLLPGHVVVPRLKPLRGFALRHASWPAKISRRAICSYLEMTSSILHHYVSGAKLHRDHERRLIFEHAPNEPAHFRQWRNRALISCQAPQSRRA